MGNSSSSSRHTDDTVDFGYLIPQGVYTGQRDWNQAIVTQLISARRLAPFYRPLEDYDESWDEDQILAARKELPDPEHSNTETVTRVETGNSSHSTKSSQTRKTNPSKETGKSEAAIYKGAVECPICFLYYPPNINHSRCCDQAICTECFVQIKRTEPTPTHLVSEPAACPYCVQENFGIIYKPPSWRAGIGSEGYDGREGAPQYATHKRRNKNVGHDAPEVVSIDTIRPDWEAKLAAVQAAVARRANRRIIMRQVGDRLIPVGVTSGRVHAISPEEAQAAEGETGSGSRRRRRQQQQQQQSGQTLDQFLGTMGMAGPDLEELMVMEAMRLSLLDHEAQQKKEAEEKEKKRKETAADSTSDEPAAGSSSQVESSEPTNSASPQASSPSDHPTSQPQETRGGSSLSSLRDKWQSSRSSPPPFSTMRAALSAASTAGAVLATSPDSLERSPPLDRAIDPPAEPTSTPSVDGVGPLGVSNTAAPRIEDTLVSTMSSTPLNHPHPIPTSEITPRSSNPSTETAESAITASSSISSTESEASQPPTVDFLSYNPLPSSPESLVTLSGDRAPLAPPADNSADPVQPTSEDQRPEAPVS